MTNLFDLKKALPKLPKGYEWSCTRTEFFWELRLYKNTRKWLIFNERVELVNGRINSDDAPVKAYQHLGVTMRKMLERNLEGTLTFD